MKPITIVLLINAALLAVFGLFFAVLVNRPEMLPFATSFQAVLNLLGAGIFYLDRKNDLSVAFLIGMGLSVGLTVLGYALLLKYGESIGYEERYTTMLNELEVFSKKLSHYL